MATRVIPKYLCFGGKNVLSKISSHYLLCQYLPNTLDSLFSLVSPLIKLAWSAWNRFSFPAQNPTKGKQLLWRKAEIHSGFNRHEDLENATTSQQIYSFTQSAQDKRHWGFISVSTLTVYFNGMTFIMLDIRNNDSHFLCHVFLNLGRCQLSVSAKALRHTISVGHGFCYLKGS